MALGLRVMDFVGESEIGAAREGNGSTMTQGYGAIAQARMAAMVFNRVPNAARSLSRSGGNSRIRVGSLAETIRKSSTKRSASGKPGVIATTRCGASPSPARVSARNASAEPVREGRQSDTLPPFLSPGGLKQDANALSASFIKRRILYHNFAAKYDIIHIPYLRERCVRMKKSLVAVFAFIAFLGQADDAKPKLRMITEATFPPYEYMRGQEIVGIDIEICRAVANRMGMELVIEDAKFDAVIPSLIANKADIAAAGITVTDDRKKNVDFSIPYVTTGCVFVRKVGTAFKTAADAKGKKIGVQSGTTSDTYCVDTLQQEPERYDSPASAVAALKAGKVEVVLADIDPAKNCVKGEPTLEISDLVTHEDYAVAVQKGDNKLLFEVNKTIKALKKSGELDKIIKKFTEESNKLKETK